MTEKKYSEDYEKLLFYKQNLSSENFSEVEERTVDFFSDKYEDLIINYYNSFRRNLSQGASFEDKLDYEESKGFKIDIPTEDSFEERVKEKYIPQYYTTQLSYSLVFLCFFNGFGPVCILFPVGQLFFAYEM